MKRAAALLVMAFAGAASAADIYHGWARGNGDLYPNSIEGYGKEGTGRVGIQPGVGDVGVYRGLRGRGSATFRQPEPFDHYHGWARGNGDLYPDTAEAYGGEGTRRVGMQPGVGDVATDRGFRGSGSTMGQQWEAFDHYHGWARGNGDLYPDTSEGGWR